MHRRCSKCLKDHPNRTEICPVCRESTDVEFVVGDRLMVTDAKKSREFEITEKLSRHADAGMSSTYLAVRTDNPRRRGVFKIAKINRRSALEREAIHLHKIESHSCIITLTYGLQQSKPLNAILTDTQDGQQISFIALNYMSGGSVKQKLRKRRRGLGVGETVRIITHVSQALDHIHNKGIVHLDVKPSNVLLKPTNRLAELLHINNQAVLSDFGVSRTKEELAEMRNRIVGTPPYNSATKFDENQLDHRVDIFALGLTLYEMLSGDNPVVISSRSKGKDTAALTEDSANKITTLLDEPQLKGKVSDDFQPIIRRAIATNKEDRYPTAGALADHLRQIHHRRLWQRRFFVIITLLLIGLTSLAAIPYIPIPSSTATPVLTIEAVETTVPVIAVRTRTASASPSLIPAITDDEPTLTSPEETPVDPTATINTQPTSTLAPTPSPLPPPPPSPPPSTGTNTGPVSGKEITLVEPEGDYDLSGNIIDFKWRWGDDYSCQLPPDGYGFELAIWNPDANTGPLGAMNAETEKTKIRCEDGIWQYTIGDFQAAPGVNTDKASQFRWRVTLIEFVSKQVVNESPPRIIKR